jgi:hypothetical protein
MGGFGIRKKTADQFNAKSLDAKNDGQEQVEQTKQLSKA